MTDSSWDNSGVRPQRAGMPLWGKLLLGCGVAFLLLMATCGGLVYWGVSKGAAALDRSWSGMRTTVEGLRTEEGARSLYRSNPGLRESYPTEEEFLKAAEEWRPNLVEIPVQRPDFKTLLREDRKLTVHTSRDNGRETVRVKYGLSNGKQLLVETDNGKITDIRVE